MDSMTTTRRRWGAAAVAIGPAVLLVGFLAHPYLTVLPDAAAVAEAAASNTTRWGVAHLLVAVGSGLLALAFLAVRVLLREAGEQRWSTIGLPFVVFASTLFAVLPGLELAPMAAAETGGDVQAVQAALTPWFVPTLVTAVVTFAIGVWGFVMGIARSGVLSPRLTGLVVGALAVMALARAVPVGVVQFYVQGAAGIVALWPLAYEMWRHPAARPAERGQPRPMTATR